MMAAAGILGCSGSYSIAPVCGCCMASGVAEADQNADGSQGSSARGSARSIIAARSVVGEPRSCRRRSYPAPCRGPGLPSSSKLETTTVSAVMPPGGVPTLMPSPNMCSGFFEGRNHLRRFRIAHPVRHFRGDDANIAESHCLHLFHRPGDGALQRGRTAESIADAITEVRKAVVPLAVGHGSVDQFVGGIAILVGETGGLGCEQGSRAGDGRQKGREIA